VSAAKPEISGGIWRCFAHGNKPRNALARPGYSFFKHNQRPPVYRRAGKTGDGSGFGLRRRTAYRFRCRHALGSGEHEK